MPRPAPQPARRVRLGFVILFFVVLFAAPVAMVVTRMFPYSAPWSVLYWAHDHIYLPIKGYTFTLFYPFSLIFWGAILFLLLLWGISFLYSPSLYQRLQVWLARKAVGRLMLHPILLRSARRFNKWGYKPQLLKEVAAQQRQIAFKRLAKHSLETVDFPALKKALRLTLLHSRILTFPPKTASTHLLALTFCQDVFMQLRRKSGGPAHKGFDSLKSALTAEMGRLIIPLVPYTEPRQLEEARAQEANFDFASIAVDLLYLLSLMDRDISGHIHGPEMPETKKESVVFHRLAASVSARQNILDLKRDELETGQNRYRVDFLKIVPEMLPILGRLSIQLAMETAALTGEINIAIGYLETIEALDFVLYRWQPERQWTREPTGLQKLALLLENLPESHMYFFCAQLAQKELTKQKETYTQSTIIRPTDLQLAQSRIHSLYHASGPDYAEGADN